MKKTIISTLTLLLWVGSSTLWATPGDSDFHWVIETTSHSETYTVFRIYQHSYQLVYEEKIPGKKLDIRKKKVRRQLEKIMDQYVDTVEQVAKAQNRTLLRGIAFR